MVHASSTKDHNATALGPVDIGYKYGPALPSAAASARASSVANNTVGLDTHYTATSTRPTFNKMAVGRDPELLTRPRPSGTPPHNPLYMRNDQAIYTPAPLPSADSSAAGKHKNFPPSKPDPYVTRYPAPGAYSVETEGKPITSLASKGLPKPTTTDPKVTPKSNKPVDKKLVLIATDPQSEIETRIERLDDGTIRTRKSWKSSTVKGEVEDGWVDVGGKQGGLKDDGEEDEEDWTLL